MEKKEEKRQFIEKHFSDSNTLNYEEILKCVKKVINSFEKMNDIDQLRFFDICFGLDCKVQDRWNLRMKFKSALTISKKAIDGGANFAVSFSTVLFYAQNWLRENDLIKVQK